MTGSSEFDAAPKAGRSLGVLIIAASLGLASCFAIPNSGPTAVSKAELYESSEPEYDAFFESLHRLQRTAAEASNEQRALRKAVATELGLDGYASMELISARFVKQLEDFSKHDSKLSIEFIGLEEGAEETDAVVTLSDASGSSRATSLTKTLGVVAKRTAKQMGRLRSAKKGIQKLREKLPMLEESVNERFRLLGPTRTKETQRNLADAHVALQSLRSEIQIADEDTIELLELLKQASPAEDAGKPPPKQ